jgi:two-component system chemotaxis response regulator CheY
MRILIIDDQADSRCMLATFLEDAGYTVVGAANGRDALSYLSRCPEPPGLILLDLAMPVMTGWDFLRAQQCNAALSAIPVVLLTARSDFQCDNLECAPAAYLQKPVDFPTLLATIRRHVAEHLANAL